METKEFIAMVLERLDSDLAHVLDGLTQTEVAWRPAHSYNPISLILMHAARSEDFFVQELMRHQPQVWEKSKWYLRFNLPVEERVRHYNEEQVNAFVSPDLAEMRNYYTEVRKETLGYLASLTPKVFFQEVKTPRGNTTVAGFFANIINHTAQHLGEMSYLRGLQLGMNK
jgi:hypothetical protein